jgi:hypothetical protein
VFSPVDPLLESGTGPQPGAIAAEDVRLFGEMAQNWFGLDSETARATALSILSANIFPTTMTAFYRSTLEVEAICSELLCLGHPDTAESQRAAIASKLLRGHHSHGFPLAPADLASLGLRVRCDSAVVEPPYDVIREIIAGIGAGAREHEEDSWIDALVATSAGWTRRRRTPGMPGPIWESGETE